MENVPSVILLTPVEFGFNDMFRENVASLGYNVMSLSELLVFRHTSIKSRLINSFRKMFLNDKAFKKTLIRQYQLNVVTNIALQYDKKRADYLLVVRPDLWDYEVVSSIADLCVYKVCYQWDGLKRYPSAIKYFPLFDKVLLFDENDLMHQNVGFQLTTNFYFDTILDDITQESDGVLYIGTYQESRMALLLELIDFFKKIKQRFTVKLYFDNKQDATKYKDNKDIHILDKRLSYNDMITILKQHNIIVDLQNSLHTGLSFRHFEGLILGKKIITNNPSVSKYEFYNEQNIFIINENNFEFLEKFIRSPFIKVDNTIVKRYSFSNWIRNAFNLPT